MTYTASRGYQVTKIVQEIASGMNDTRPKLLKLLTRFGFYRRRGIIAPG